MLEERDAEELVLVLAGYFTLATELDLSVTHVKSVSDEQCEYSLSAFLLKMLHLFGFNQKLLSSHLHIRLDPKLNDALLLCSFLFGNCPVVSAV